jgi:succinate dehydrogenase/fumarate reductase cytochrome b subunit
MPATDRTRSGVEKLLIVAMLGIIVYNLVLGCYHMLTDKGQSTKTVKALTWRIGLSIFLIIMIGIGIKTGHIKPHSMIEGQIKSQQR